MNKTDWISAHRQDLVVRQGMSERTASLLAPSVAAAHERISGPDVSLWPKPDQPIVGFSTSNEEDEPTQ